MTGTPGRRVDDQLLGERVPDALDHAALDLARRTERVDDPTDVVDCDDALDGDDAGAGIDGDLRDLTAEGVDAEAVGVRAARAGPVDRRVAELAGHLDDVDVERAVARADTPVPHREVVRGDLEDVGRELEQDPPHLAGGAPDRGHHGGRRHRAAGDGPVEVRGRVAAACDDVIERQAELLGGDDPAPRSASRCRCPGFRS